MISDNLVSVRQNIARSAQKAGRKPQDITLVCVTKEAGVEQIRQAIASGVSDIGENRVQDAAEKYKEIASLTSFARNDVKLRWHLIGHLQANKVKKAVEIFDLIHSVDSLGLAEEISKRALSINKTQDILIQVNVSGEESKFGIMPDELKPLIDNIVLLNNIRLLGLMTIASLTDNSENVRPYFRRLRELSKQAGLKVLSMGMSNDYQAAIEEGATMVRIGSAIFK